MSNCKLFFSLQVKNETPAKIYHLRPYPVAYTGEDISILTNGEMTFPTLKSEKGWKGLRLPDSRFLVGWYYQ